MTPEEMSLFAVVLSGSCAVVSAAIPAIVHVVVKRLELKAQKQREEGERYEREFEKYYLSHVQIVKEFQNLYENWKVDCTAKSEIMIFIHEIAHEFRSTTHSKLEELYKSIGDFKHGDDVQKIDEKFQSCIQLILERYGLKLSGSTPNYFISDMLRIVLREQFDVLKKSKSKDLNLSTEK